MAKNLKYGKPRVRPKARPKVVFEVGQRVMVNKPSAMHKAHHGLQGIIMSVSGWKAEVKLYLPLQTEKQREFAFKELKAL